MKYLKTFESDEFVKASIVPKEVQDEITDILLDLSDSGYTVNYYWENSRYYPILINDKPIESGCIYIRYRNYTMLHTLELVIDTINRLKEYLDYIGYDTKEIKILQTNRLYIQFFKLDGDIKVSTSNAMNRLSPSPY